jgi:hypothetical protein
MLCFDVHDDLCCRAHATQKLNIRQDGRNLGGVSAVGTASSSGRDSSPRERSDATFDDVHVVVMVYSAVHFPVGSV